MRSLTGSFAVALLLACSSGGGSDGGTPPSGNDTHNQMLETLGVNTEVGRRTNSQGQAVPDGYNPTLRLQTTLMRRDELFVAGARTQVPDAPLIPAPKVHAFLDWPDGATLYTAGSLATDDAWLQLPKAAGAGDVDGDGKDEAIVAYRGPGPGPGAGGDPYALSVKFLQRAPGGGYAVLSERTVRTYSSTAIDQYPDHRLWWHNFGVAAGDVDGNGKAETLVTFNGSAFLLGDASRDYALLRSIDYTRSGDTAYRFLRAASGDVDNDGRDEFVVVESSIQKANWWKGTARYQILEGTELADVDHGALAVTDPALAQTVTLRCANVAVGDVDADGLAEVVFAGMPQDVGTYYVFVLDTSWSKAATAFVHGFVPKFTSLAGRYGYDFAPPTFVADFDGDGKAEILALNRMYEGLGKTAEGVATGSFVDKGINLWYPNPVGDLPTPLGYAYDAAGSATIGDVDGDGKVDLVYVGDSWYEAYWVGFDSAGRWAGKKRLNIWDSATYFPIVAAGDFDGDSMLVEFVESETLFSDPHPVAVLASNPFWSGVDMGGQTSIGYLKSTGEETTSAIGFTTGFSIGYESEGIFDLWDVSIKTSFESAFDWTASEAVTISETHTWTTRNQDTVVFTAIPYDVYYYRVVRGPDPAAAGKIITVNLPRKPIIRPVDRGFYNAKNGGAPDIEPATLGGSVVGDPLSYPSSAAADLLIQGGGGKGLKSKSMELVGQGNVESSIEMSLENAKGTGTAFDFDVKVEAEAGAGGWKAGVSAGFHYGESYTVTSTNATIYGGAVDGLPPADDVPARQFKWGLFTYQTRAGGSPEFVVVQYYVEPAQ